MSRILIYAMVYLGSALMVYNIYGFVRFVRDLQSTQNWGNKKHKLYIPVVLLAFFLLGYLMVGIFGSPDLVVSGILFGGSIFVYIMYCFLNRVTSHIRQAERLEIDLLTAEKSNRAKSSFMATMSHEMRTPLNVIIGLSSVALKESKDAPSAKTRDQFEKIKLSALHLLGLINNILDMNRIESGALVLKNEEFLLRDALDQINAIVQTECEQKGLEYEARATGVSDTRYLGDAVQLKQVLLSILDNAVKFTDAPGRVTFLTEESSADEELRTVRFVVCDTGVGMDEEFLPKVFGAFAQEDASHTNRYGGSGLSLAVAKSTVDAMGGSIEVHSKKGEGSIFTVAVPLVVVPCAKLAPKPRLDESVELRPASLDGRHILVVEDVEENAEIVADLLDLEGATTEHAQNGWVAVDMIAHSPEYRYDAVLMDLRMPVMDGFEAARCIRGLDRTDTKSMPIIALTANAFEEDMRRSSEAGMDAHLAKPADADVLYKTIGNLIQLALQKREEGVL